jgi:hypothetical protein
MSEPAPGAPEQGNCRNLTPPPDGGCPSPIRRGAGASPQGWRRG